MKQVKKTYGHELGLSATFRQWRAKSHCRFLHGYALAFTFTFECADNEVDENGWVIDFGGLKPLKEWLQETFDHKLCVAEDDPGRERLEALGYGSCPAEPMLADLKIFKAVGCEAFAELAWSVAARLCETDVHLLTKARCVAVECREHGANAATYIPDRAATWTQNHIVIDGRPTAQAIQEAVAQALRVVSGRGAPNAGR
jgi:6-pyruvoyltetrahydropterin/6-carboxytetrahydropterin synthase